MAQAVELASTVVVADGLRCTQVDGEVVVLNPRSGAYFTLGSTGTFIWQQVQKPCVVAQVRDEMANAYGEELATCEADVLRFLGELAEEGLVLVDGSK